MDKTRTTSHKWLVGGEILSFWALQEVCQTLIKSNNFFESYRVDRRLRQQTDNVVKPFFLTQSVSKRRDFMRI